MAHRNYRKLQLLLLLTTLLLYLLLWLFVQPLLVENILTANCNKFSEISKSRCHTNVTNGTRITASQRCSNLRHNDDDDDDDDDDERYNDGVVGSYGNATDQRSVARWFRWSRWWSWRCSVSQRGGVLATREGGASRSGAAIATRKRLDYGVCGGTGNATQSSDLKCSPPFDCVRQQQTAANRAKRFIIFDGAGVVKLVLGVSYPIKLAVKSRSLSYFYNLQLQYVPPPRPLYWWSPFNTTTFAARVNRVHDPLPHDVSRQLIYAAIEAALEREGLPGVSCLLRTICDITVQPFHTDRDIGGAGIFHELLNAIFTPELANVKGRYLRARRAGQTGADCAKIFSKCPVDRDWLKRISHFL